MNVTLRQLQAFVTVARLGSFALAAREMSVTPSALSALIRELESAVELRLLDRSTRKVLVSDAGREYLPHSQAVLQAVESARRCALELRQHQRGTVRIVATQVMFWTVLPALFAAFREAHAGIALIPVEVPVDRIVATLELGHADFAMFAERKSAPSIGLDHLFDTSGHLVCRTDHRLARRRKVKWSEVNAEPLIFIGAEALPRMRAELGFVYDLPAATSVGSGTTALGLVSAGMGLAVIMGMVKPVLAPLGLHMVELTSPVVSRRVMLYRRREKVAPAAQEVFRAFALDYFRGRSVRVT